MVLLGLFLNILPQLLITTFSFVVLRVWTGGLHFNSYTKCAYISLLTFTIMGLAAKYVYIDLPISIIIFLIVFFIFLLYAPVEHINRQLNNNEKINFKEIALILLIIQFLIYTNIINTAIANSIVFGVLLAGVIATPIINKLK